MAQFVVDASVAVEYLLRTELGLIAADTIDYADLIAPELLDAEVLSTLRQDIFAGQIGEARALAALEDLASWSVTRLPLLPLVKTAWLHRHNVSAYDAFYVAAAIDNDARVITVDGRLSRAPGLGVDVLHVRSP